jgi:hypothetical protein
MNEWKAFLHPLSRAIEQGRLVYSVVNNFGQPSTRSNGTSWGPQQSDAGEWLPADRKGAGAHTCTGCDEHAQFSPGLMR